MKIIYRLILSGVLLFSTLPASADDPYNPGYNPVSDSIEKLVKYFVNMGEYMGFDVTRSPADQQPAVPIILLTPITTLSNNYIYASWLMLGAVPMSALNKLFIPNSSAYAGINALSNNTFPNYSSENPQQDTVSVNKLIDQKTYQGDPVTQAVLNTLGTPDSSYCLSPNSISPSGNCELLSEDKVVQNVIGDSLPATDEFFTYDYNQKFLSQLNINSLIGPLFYSSPGATTSTSSTTTAPKGQGLTAPADNQLQIAANFIRYASGIVAPIPLAKRADYDSLYVKTLKSNNESVQQKIAREQATATLASYLTKVRIFAAQNSVPIGNLYYIMSKRMPQTLPAIGNNQPPPVSLAMSEFQMATWRLFSTESPQWTEKINTASPATVQKEIAILLAEMNYQLYLNRQQEERLLLTNSMLLIQSVSSSRPTSPSASAESNQ